LILLVASVPAEERIESERLEAAAPVPAGRTARFSWTDRSIAAPFDRFDES
jgi:hypothetical protein